MAFYKSLKTPYLYPPGTSEPGQAGWIAEHLLRVRKGLATTLTEQRRPGSLVIGSWNIRHFDGGRPRLRESFHYIAEIIDHFDICALQEVRNVEAVDHLIRLLGPNWRYFINDNATHEGGNNERMAFLYDSNRVFFRNLVGELVVDKTALPDQRQIARTPFFAAFQAGWFRFTLCSAHILFGENAGGPTRADEIRVVGEILRKRARAQDEVHVLLGDLNTDSRAHPGLQALLQAGYLVPDLGPTNLGGTKTYDQIAMIGPDQESNLVNSGVVRWQDWVFRDDEMTDYQQIAQRNRGGQESGQPYADWPGFYPTWRTHEMSDHLPVWIELLVDYSDEYLQRIADL